jgi:hypothetical protein
VVEVLHFMGGEDSPRRVLCPWLAHRLPLASTLPAVARATAVCFLRCECLRERPWSESSEGPKPPLGCQVLVARLPDRF